MTDPRRELQALYFTRFANAFGLVTLATLLPKFINQLGAEGFIMGMFASGLTFAQAVGIVPISWAGDRYDKRTVLLGGIGLASVVYLAFAFVETSWAFIAVRGLQGIAATAGGLIALALVGTSRGSPRGPTPSGRPTPGGSRRPSAGRSRPLRCTTCSASKWCLRC